MNRDRYSSRLGMMLVMLGMAVGTGNIWRFPRIAASNGGGEFLVAWIVFLFLWSIPLVLVEFGMGRQTRRGPIGAFIQLMGPRWAWMGAFIALATAAIMSYYSVVAGWTLRYALAAIFGQLGEGQPSHFWTEFTSSWLPVITHGIAIGLATLVVARGVLGIERIARVLMPAFIGLVFLLMVRAVTLPGATEGLAYLFGVDWGELARAELWIEALTQNAWDTGAGWGLALCYAAYLREEDDTALNAFILPAANNILSLMAGIMVICTVFSVVPNILNNFAIDPRSLDAYPLLAESVNQGRGLTASLLQETIFGAGNEGLTFIWMPQLFATIPFGNVFMVLFFSALAFAAFTSLIAMVELVTRVLIDLNMSRKQSAAIVGVGAFLLGFPSSVSLIILRNQDWVWGMALMLSGLFLAIAVMKYGVRKFRECQLNHESSDIRIGSWWDLTIRFIVPIEASVLFFWWLGQARSLDPVGWLSPFSEANVGTVLVQIGLALVVVIVANRWLVTRTRT